MSTYFTGRLILFSCAIFAITSILLLSSCGRRANQQEAAAASDWTPRSNLTQLTLVGFNYTNREISNFSVDGSGGGNVHVSGLAGGGGGNVCCVLYVAGSDVSSHVVRWDAESCRFYEFGNVEIYDIRAFYKEEIVKVDGAPLERAHYFEVHFFPDGSVKAKVTNEISRPLLSLPVERDRKKSPPCSTSVEPKR